MAGLPSQTRSATAFHPARRISHTDGLVACPAACRRYRTAPPRLSAVDCHHPHDRGACRVRCGQREELNAGSRICRSASSGAVVLWLSVLPVSHQAASGCARSSCSTTIAPTRLVCRRRAGWTLPASPPLMAHGPVAVDEGAFAACARQRQGRGGCRKANADQAAISKVLSRSSWPISWRRRRMRGP